MPNYIRNRIILNGTFEKIQSLYDKFNTHIPAKIVKNSSGYVQCKNTTNDEYGFFNPYTGDFQDVLEKKKQKGLPNGWEIVIEQSFNYFPDFRKIIPPPQNMITRSITFEEMDEYKKQGIPTWYHWNIENWGTKWNALNIIREGINTFIFETAWNSVPKIIAEMSRQFPQVIIEYSYADEDTGYNCGEYEYKAGEIVRQHTPKGGSKEAYEIAFKLFPELKEDYALIENNYQCIIED
ncbi:hypothetical protein PG630_10630 [Riemerella anatipestifer]|nr:hypothetical protein [Riemerella anatipestifer]